MMISSAALAALAATRKMTPSANRWNLMESPFGYVFW
jgi:hypothetical protein